MMERRKRKRRARGRKSLMANQRFTSWVDAIYNNNVSSCLLFVLLCLAATCIPCCCRLLWCCRSALLSNCDGVDEPAEEEQQNCSREHRPHDGLPLPTLHRLDEIDRSGQP